MQHPFEFAADLDTPVSAFLKLRSLKARFLLESVEGGERRARYSFLGFGDGSMEMRLGGGGLRVGAEQRPFPPTASELLNVFRGALRRAPRPGPPKPGLPYAGGLVGVAGYDLARWFEPAIGASPTGEPPVFAYLAPRSLLVFDHLTHRITLLHDGPEPEQRALQREVVAALRGPVANSRRSARHEFPHASLDRDVFMEKVREVQKRIRDGDVYQTVLSIRFTGECEADPFLVYRALRSLNPSPYMYYFEFEDVCVVGSSPEALVRLNGREAELRPIAGTRRRGENELEDRALEEELLADSKEAAEHVMLVDLCRNDLGRLAVPGTITVSPSRVIERYSHVMHLVSGVRGTIPPDVDGLELFAAAFPAGTVVGAPKIRAMQLIDELEPVARGVYAGSCGYFGFDGGMDQAIAIRTLTFHNGCYSYQAGAGIVADSVPSREHDEVLAKSAVLDAALAGTAAKDIQ